MVFYAADKLDKEGNVKARGELAEMKVFVPTVACNILDRAI